MGTDEIDLNEVVEDSLIQLMPKGQDGIRITCRLSPLRMTFQGGQRQIQEAVEFLIQRALQAVGQSERDSRGPGRVELSSGPQPRSKGLVFLEIADDGPELGQGLQRKLRHPFAGSSNGPASHALLRTRDIIETNGGRFCVEAPRADLGRGTRIRIKLPALVSLGVPWRSGRELEMEFEGKEGMER